MTTKARRRGATGRKRRGVNDWESLLPEADDAGKSRGKREADDPRDADTGIFNVDQVLDVRTLRLDPDKPEAYFTGLRTGRDDNPEPAPKVMDKGRDVKVKSKTGKTQKIRIIESGQIVEQLKIKPTSDPVGEIVEAGHSYMIEDYQSRPWKTAHRTHCGYCAGEMPTPDAAKHVCEFSTGGGLPFSGCQCSGCTLRQWVVDGAARNAGGPRKYCGDDCARLAKNERDRWGRAVKKARKLGQEPPPEPEDRGRKLIQSSGLRAGLEGTGHRYISSTVGLSERAPVV